MCTIILLIFLLPFFALKFAGQALKIITLLFLIGSAFLLVIFSIIFAILYDKKFFSKYKDGWKKIASKLVKYGLIIEMISNIACFLVCLFIKSIFLFFH